ncbi:S9 family peptidase [Agrobacterium fabrum]|uniref:prolyl oligopeptidase family serine peptidase n=1 Tax=Agrobacterium fabrum TaxID=1176649 RepID=UPI000EF5E9E4|nr:prolyl oligopeptidase family serine peptidase [Agrobacterium fabrum]NTE63640.1 S9 family peptidase [Agrobacterium fabrum]
MKAHQFALAVCVLAPSVGAQPEFAAAKDVSAGHSWERNTTPIQYPETSRGSLVDNRFGVSVADPYRWLEGDPRTDRKVADWVAAQQRTTTAYLSGLPGRAMFRRALASTYEFERIGVPQKKAGRYFFTRKLGDQNQPVLVVRENDGSERVLLDPAAWSKDGTVTFAEWRASPDGSRVAYAEQDGGSDWRTIRVIDVATGQITSDSAAWARFTQIAWAEDGSGFYYSRYPEPKPGVSETAGLTNHAVYFHRLGTPQLLDELIFSTPLQPGKINSAGITPDKRYVILYSSADLVHADISVIDLQSGKKPRPLIQGAQERWSVVGSVGAKLLLMTDQHAARARIVSIDLEAAVPEFTELVSEQDAILTAAYFVGDRLIATYLADAKSEIRRYKLDGTPDGVVTLPGIGTVSAVAGEPQDDEVFLVYTSFNQPNAVYRYDVASGELSAWATPRTRVDLSSIVVEQRFFRSKDGTSVPMFIVRRKDVTGPVPTLLTGYGAFAINMPPGYSAMLTPWVLNGGALAIANIRGGGENGAQWHAGGSGRNKQNGFDDMVAAAEYLHATKIAPKDGLAIYGDSAGGLLAGVVVNQRPDLFAAALPSVGVMDMLRFDHFTGGALWIGEYGNPATEADFRNLLSYSPYHNIKAGKEYPAILATTAEADDRVVPAHSFKYVAALQAADIGPRPRLLRVDARSGHGTGKPTSKVIEEAADMLAFAARWTGLQVNNERGANTK